MSVLSARETHVNQPLFSLDNFGPNRKSPRNKAHRINENSIFLPAGFRGVLRQRTLFACAFRRLPLSPPPPPSPILPLCSLFVFLFPLLSKLHSCKKGFTCTSLRFPSRYMEEGTGQESRVFRRVRDLCYPTKKKRKEEKRAFLGVLLL